jgi:hypothetical protein
MSLNGSHAGLLLAVLVAGCGGYSEESEVPATPPAPPPAPAAEPPPTPEPYASSAPPTTPSSTPPSPPPPPPPTASGAPPSGAPPAEPQVYSYPSGQWVYLSGQGWVWVPAGASTTDMEGVPYTYLYTPAYGWTWYVSPWGAGPYHYGVWIRHPWHPVGLHGYWVARPHAVIRLGPGRFRR